MRELGYGRSVETTTRDVHFLEHAFPLLVCVAPSHWDDAQVHRMIEGYERYFVRGERYALLSHTPKGAGLAGAKQMRQIVDWANEPRVRSLSTELCVGSSTVVREAFSRAALTAILWFWKPPAPHRAAATPREALEFCLERMRAEKLAIGRTEDELRELVLPGLEVL